MNFVGLSAGEQVVGDWIFEIGRVEINEIIGTASRDVIENFFCQVAMRIEEGTALAALNVIDKKIPQQR